MAFGCSDATLSSPDGNEWYIGGDIYRWNEKYNFSKRLFAHLITQYNSFDEQLQAHLLMYYNDNPFTKFYIGMTDYLNHSDRQSPNGIAGCKEINCRYFMKFQYQVRC